MGGKNYVSQDHVRVKFIIPWSRLRYDDNESLKEYNMFQNCIKEMVINDGVLPIEMDFIHRNV